MPDSSDIAGAVHTWPLASFRCRAVLGRFRSEAGIDLQTQLARPVENDPKLTSYPGEAEAEDSPFACRGSRPVRWRGRRGKACRVVCLRFLQDPSCRPP